jgi:hypothetical protein
MRSLHLHRDSPGDRAASDDVSKLYNVRATEEVPEVMYSTTSAAPCPDKYLLYRTPIHGLNNQKSDVIAAIALSKALNRTLLLPYLFTDLITSTNPTVTPFSKVFDVKHLKAVGGGLGYCVDDFHEVTDIPTGDIRTVYQSSMESLQHYVRTLEDSGFVDEQYVMIQRHPTKLSQLPVNLNVMPAVVADIRQGLRHSETIRDVADGVIGVIGSGDYIALHLRIEDDWKDHCKRREFAHFNGRVKICYDYNQVLDRLRIFIDHSDVKNLYIAIGDNVASEDMAVIRSTVNSMPNVRAFFKNDVIAQSRLANFTHLELAALDYVVCESSTYFIGSSYSSFAAEVSKTLVNTSYIYNIDSDMDGVGFSKRHDSGYLVEPHDVVNYSERVADLVSTFLVEKASSQKTTTSSHPNATLLTNPYPIVRADVSAQDGSNKQRTFVLFETDSEDSTIVSFCAELLLKPDDRLSCQDSLKELVDSKKQAALAASEFEQSQRKHCSIRLPAGFSVPHLVDEFMAQHRGVYSSFALAHSDFTATLLPSMDAVGWEVQTDKVTHHGYHRFYSKYLPASLRQSPLTLLEIGLAKGSSMNMWCGLLPTANIVGVDITLHSDCQPCSLGEGIHVFSGDSGDSALLQRLTASGVTYDIVVDDGAHTPSSQMAAFNYLFVHALVDGGVYFIEDIETSYWTRGELYGNTYSGGGLGQASAGQNVIEVFKALADSVNSEFFTSSRSHPEAGRYIDATAAGMVEGIEFGHNIVAIRKKSKSKHGMYYDREYRMAGFVEGYVYE